MPSRSTADIAAALVAHINAEIMAAGHPITATDRFDAVGIDSMALLKVLLFIEQEWGFWVPDEDLVEPTVASVDGLAAYVATRLGAAG